MKFGRKSKTKSTPPTPKAAFIPSSDRVNKAEEERQYEEWNAKSSDDAGPIQRPIPGLQVVGKTPTRNDHFTAGATAHHIYNQTDDSDPASPFGISLSPNGVTMGNTNNRPYDQDTDDTPRKKITISTLPNKEEATKRPSVGNPTPGTADKAKSLKAVPSNAAKQRAKLNQTPEDKRASNALKNIQKKGK